MNLHNKNVVNTVVKENLVTYLYKPFDCSYNPRLLIVVPYCEHNTWKKKRYGLCLCTKLQTNAKDGHFASRFSLFNFFRVLRHRRWLRVMFF